MAKSSGDTDHADVEPEFSAVADELYALRPEEFIGARDERVRLARGEGKRALARELGRLRRPTQSAWLVNALWRDSREVFDELLQLATELAQAQQQGGVRSMHELTARRRRLEATLLDRAGELAGAAGVRASAETLREVQETLVAALSLPDVAAEVRTGRMVRPASYAGFGMITPQQQAPRPAPRERAEPTGAGARREQAERRVDEARAAAESAAAALAERESAVEAAERRAAELRERVEQLRQQLRDLERDAATAEREVEAASRARDRAEEANRQARQALELAEQRSREEG